MKLENRCIEISVGGDVIQIESGLTLELRQRIITATGVTGYSIHEIRSGKKKVVYLYYQSNNTACPEQVKTQDEVSTHLASFRSIKTRVGGFLTIITSGQFIVDYVVIGEREVAIVIPGKRQVYIEENKNVVTIYIV